MNNYFLLLQSDIIISMIEYSYISTINAIDWFHQFNMRKLNRQKLIVINHRDQKKFSVTLMKYKDSSFYVQRQTDVMLRSYKKFIKVYVDDIIIYSRILIEHVIHLIKIFDLFRVKRVSLAFIKFYLKYSSVTLLNQKIDSLSMFISTKKIVVIIAFRFLNSLKNIDHFLDFTEYLRSSILKYVQRVNSLQKKKIIFIKQLFNIKELFKKRKIIRTRL